MHQTSMAIRVRHRRVCVMPMPMHMHDKATQATPVGVICSGRPRSYHNASGVMQRIPGGCITWAVYIIWAGFITWASCRNSNISTVIPPIDHFVRVAGVDGNFGLQQGWYNKRKGACNSMVTLRSVRTPHLLLSPRCAPPLCVCRLPLPFACYHPRSAPTDSAAWVQTIITRGGHRKGTIRAAPAVRCDPASTGSARRLSSTRRPAAPEGR